MPRLARTPASRRLLPMLAVALVVAVPAGILRARCVGDTCKSRGVSEGAQGPFCSLPRPLRDQVQAGYRKARSPEILGVAAQPLLAGPTGPRWRKDADSQSVAWPAVTSRGSSQSGVAVALGGTGMSRGEVPEGASLADLAPTVAAVIGLERPHPEVRSGSAWPGFATGERPSLVLQIIWKGAPPSEAFGTEPLREIAARGLGDRALAIGSLPVDAAALMATIGSGAAPSEHGITGTYTRSEEGSLVKAWAKGAPGSVVAMWADDLDEATEGSDTALVGDAAADIGLIGSDWYLSGDRDEVVLRRGVTPQDQSRKAVELLRKGYGRDEGTDLLAVTMQGDVSDLERATERLIESADEATSGDVLYLIASLPTGNPPGSPAATSPSSAAAQIESEVGAPVIEAIAGGGFFLDQEVIANEGITEDAILAAMDEIRTSDGQRVFADRFSGVAVTFARYC